MNGAPSRSAFATSAPLRRILTDIREDAPPRPVYESVMALARVPSVVLRSPLALAVVLLSGCGASAPPPPVAAPEGHAASEAPPPSTSRPAAPAPRPDDVVVWFHTDRPQRVATLADSITASEQDDGLGIKRYLQLCDGQRPLDVASVAKVGAKDVLVAAGFGVASEAAFLTAAAQGFDVSQPAPGKAVLVAKDKGKGDDGGAKAAAHRNLVCDTSGADGAAHRVVCGDDGVSGALVAWLAGAPQPATPGDLARVEIYAAPIQAAAHADTKAHGKSLKQLLAVLDDASGMTVRLNGGDGAPVRLDVDLTFAAAGSPWTKGLLAHDAPVSSHPAPNVAWPTGTSFVVQLPGGGPWAPLLLNAGELLSSSALLQPQAKPLFDEVHAILQRPIVCGEVTDLDAGRAALARVVAGPHADLLSSMQAPKTPADAAKRKAHEALEASLGGVLLCAIQEKPKDTERLLRGMAKLAPANHTVVIRPAAGLGLPAGSLVVDDTTRPDRPAASKDTKKAKPERSTTFAVPDGETTWLVFADTVDPRAAAHLASGVLGAPRTTEPLPSGQGTVLTGYVTTLAGAFAWDLAVKDYDAVQKTLGEKPGRLFISLAQQPAGDAGTFSVHLSSDVSSLRTLGKRAGVVMLGAGFILALAASDDSDKP